MRLKELIDSLLEAYREHGDLPVYRQYPVMINDDVVEHEDEYEIGDHVVMDAGRTVDGDLPKRLMFN